MRKRGEKQHLETFTIQVNGIGRTIRANRTTPLLSILREHLHLTGAKPGCGEGQCGACTVLLAGEPVRSCLTAVGDVGERPVQTIEGLAQGSALHPVQQAFLDTSAFQCGYCTPGMIMASVGLLSKNPHPTVSEIQGELAGNVCRCGTYSRIIQAVQQAAKGVKRA
jgi:aerobic-type carbon monoxide dehydrogenase small subunit (CoxS/CutS family)